MAAPGSEEEGRDTGRGGFNEGGGRRGRSGGKGKGKGKGLVGEGVGQTAWPLSSLGRLAGCSGKHRMWAMQAGRTGLDIHPSPHHPASRPHTHTIPFLLCLTLSCLPPSASSAANYANSTTSPGPSVRRSGPVPPSTHRESVRSPRTRFSQNMSRKQEKNSFEVTEVADGFIYLFYFFNLRGNRLYVRLFCRNLASLFAYFCAKLLFRDTVM